MYGIYANIGGILMVNVTIYGIHGSYGIENIINIELEDTFNFESLHFRRPSSALDLRQASSICDHEVESCCINALGMWKVDMRWGWNAAKDLGCPASHRGNPQSFFVLIL